MEHQHAGATASPWSARLLWAATALVLVVLAWPLFQGKLYVEDDLGCYHLPLRTAFQEALHNGSDYGWNPYIFNGFYIQGEGQVGMTHPLHRALYQHLPLDTAFMLELLFSYPFAFLGMAWLLQRWHFQRAAALYGAFLFAFLGYSMNHYVHLHFVAAFAHLPWSLACIDLALRGETPARRWGGRLALILLGASQLMLGAVQPTYFAWLVELLYAIALAWPTRALGGLLLLGLVKAVALLLAGQQLLTMWEALQTSYRANPDAQFQLSISLRPWNLIQWVQPYLFQGRVFATQWKDEPWDAPYLGAATPALMILAFAWRRHWPREGQGLVLAAWGLTLFGVLAALGAYGFLHPLLDLIPVVNKLRAPARYLALAHFAMAIAAAAGVCLLACQHRGRVPRALALPAILSVTVALAVELLRRFGPENVQAHIALHYMATAPILFGALLVVTATVLVALAARGRTWALPLLIALTITDAGLYSLRHKPATTLDAFVQAIDVPPVPGNQGEVAIDPDIHPSTMNLPMMLGYRTPFGYVSLAPARKLDYTQELPLRLAGVSWRRARLAEPALHEAALRGETWVPLADPFPKVRLVTQCRLTGDPARDLATIDHTREALVEVPIELDGGPPGTVEIHDQRPGFYSLTVHSPGRQLLIFGESYHAGWLSHAKPGPAIRVNGDFFGVVVDGDAWISAQFLSPGWMFGSVFAVLGQALTILLGIIALARIEYTRRRILSERTGKEITP
jgi:hypothetical protein